MITKDFVKSSLIRKNYFPSQKDEPEELPPIFTTENLTDEVIIKIEDLPYKRKSKGFDHITLRSTKFNNVARIISIPHPQAYLNLVDKISTHWPKIKSITSNKNSIVKPMQHKDGRIIIMNYESNFTKTRKILNNSFSNKYLVNTDIKNFYPSIYSHSIPWALVGKKTSKNNRESSHWYNQIDIKTRGCSRNETNGVAIGPATSNIIAEIILSEIDKKLRRNYPNFVRYIDDYSVYTKTKEDAENFILELERYLSEYKLLLNRSKTIIEEQPLSISPNWISDLTTRIPKKENITLSEAIRFLDYANEINEKYPAGSILKYAIKSILSKLENKAVWGVLDYSINMSYSYPILIPQLGKLIDRNPSLMTPERKSKLKVLLQEHSRYNRNDIVCWLIFYCIKYRIQIRKDIREAVLKTEDCMSIYLLLYKDKTDDVVTYIKNISKTNDIHLKDNYWLLLYEAYRQDIISTPYQEKCFEIMKSDDVVFHNCYKKDG